MNGLVGLTDDKLTDDEEFWAGHQFRWVAGGIDGAFGHHSGGGNEEANVKEMVQLLAKQSRKPSNKTRRATYLKLMQKDVISVIDPLLEALRKHPGINVQNLYNEVFWLAETGAHRNVVKFGIALLGQFETENHRDLVLTLGKHDEFTLYSAVAIQNSLESANEALFELAKSVNGWGKIQLVERLEPDTQEIKDWLLRKGCQNSVMYEYLAFTCAQKGELHIALKNRQVDLELYVGASDIISALITGGPAEDMDDYEHASLVVGEYLRLARTMCTTVPQLTVIIDILDFLDQDEDCWSARYSKGWTEESRNRYRLLCQGIISDEGWAAKVWEDIHSGSNRSQYSAIRAAKALGLDIWPELFKQLQQTPENGSLYFELMRTENSERVKKLVAHAEEALPLSDIASGPSEEMGLGPGFEPHSALDSLVQDLDRHVGVGRKLIETALQSPVVRNRNMALKALEAWPIASWGDSLISKVKKLAEVEPDSSVKERIEKLMQENGI
ncbi:limonene hydroxylase [Cohnella silvisoli]|uniref:Limonene hydroxylase n=1 Tax=Cohnella silvisoli TaxID=2873699 RepID=A0ABV1KN01_9BACL|nr:limonene hydroxylase [Cohnella silvisoli]